MARVTAAALRDGLPTAVEMRAAREQGWQDGHANRGRAVEHESYLGKDRHGEAITYAYNRGYIIGRQQLVQDLYGDPPTT